MFHFPITGVFPNCMERCGLLHLNGEKKLQNWQYTSVKWKGPYLRVYMIFVFIRLISKPYGDMNYKKNISMIRFNCSILLLQYCYTKRKSQHCVKSLHIRSYSVCIFPHSQCKCRKMRTGITPNTDTFYAVQCIYLFWRSAATTHKKVL